MPGAGAPARPTTPAFSNPGSGIGRGTRPTQAIANECMSGAEHGRHRADAISTCFVPSTVRPVFQEERERERREREREREKRIRKKKEKRDLSEINYYLSLLPSFLSTFSTTTSFTRTSHVYLLFLLFHLSPLGVGRNFISTRDYFTYVEAETGGSSAPLVITSLLLLRFPTPLRFYLCLLILVERESAFVAGNSDVTQLRY